MIGQEKILSMINNSTLDTFPNSLILLGEKGSGKHSLTNLISEHLHLQIVDISEKLTQEMIDEIYMKPEPYIYVISSDKLNIKNQNSILKFLEEPLKNSYIILLVENKNMLLPTIINRCQIWQLEKYTKEQLKTLLGKNQDENILDVVTTPGDIEMMSHVNNNYDEMLLLCEKIVDKIPVASFSNVLSISDKIKFTEKDKNNENKYDLGFTCDNTIEIPISNTIKISISKLIEAGKIDGDIKNPINNDDLTNKEVSVTFNCQTKQFTYDFDYNCQ